MKRLLLLLLPTIAFSQNLDYARSLNSIRPAEIKTIADDIASTFSVPMQFYGTYKTIGNEQVLMYYPADLPERVIKEDAEKPSCELCTEFYFDGFDDGANKDLGVAGTKMYSFSHVYAKYLDLFPWWQKNFAPGVSKEDLLDKESDKRYIQKSNPNINIRFTKQMDDWEVRNYR